MVFLYEFWENEWFWKISADDKNMQLDVQQYLIPFLTEVSISVHRLFTIYQKKQNQKKTWDFATNWKYDAVTR